MELVENGVLGRRAPRGFTVVADLFPAAKHLALGEHRHLVLRAREARAQAAEVHVQLKLVLPDAIALLLQLLVQAAALGATAACASAPMTGREVLNPQGLAPLVPAFGCW